MATVTSVPPEPARAAEVCKRYEPRPEARRLLREDLSSEEYTALLVEQHREGDAVEFLAHELTARQAVWWGCLCAWEAARPDPRRPEPDSLAAAVRWVEDSGEDNRLRAEAAGRADPDTPAGCVALAAARTGGSVAPPDCPVVPPGPFLPARTVSSAVRLAAAVAAPNNLAEKLRLYLRIGREVADGLLPWEASARRPVAVR